MTGNVDDIRARLSKKLEPHQIRLTLMHASLMQLVHEFIKQWVLMDVKAFYGYDNIIGDGTWLSEGSKERYQQEVLGLALRKEFKASAIWLEQGGAITRIQRERLDEIYAYRHKLAHEGVAFIVDIERTPDATMLTDALEIARDLDRFWKGIAKDIGTYDAHGDVDLEDMHSGKYLVLQLCVDAYLTAEGASVSGE
jgi:hypothetical protein